MYGVLFLGDIGIVILFTVLYWFVTAKKMKQTTEYTKFFLGFLSTYFSCFFIIIMITGNLIVWQFIFLLLLFPILFMLHYYYKFKYTQKNII